MENREFISAANLPTTEAEEVDVLCLDNGELKRKAAKGLGGGGYDLKVRAWFELDKNDEMMPKGEVLEGSFEAVKQKFDSELPAFALIVEDGTALTENPYKSIVETNMTARYNPENLEDMIFTGWGCECTFGITPDNTIVFQ